MKTITQYEAYKLWKDNKWSIVRASKEISEICGLKNSKGVNGKIYRLLQKLEKERTRACSRGRLRSHWEVKAKEIVLLELDKFPLDQYYYTGSEVVVFDFDHSNMMKTEPFEDMTIIKEENEQPSFESEINNSSNQVQIKEESIFTEPFEVSHESTDIFASTSNVYSAMKQETNYNGCFDRSNIKTNNFFDDLMD
ncbi:unnamed protein product [Meganyctiphanes norvegica]|uniref:Uncharacterized protein n=1 Tax=Meganyctiphanes norvegica TaxID=48144 RepID=A0AAV2SUB9_MEGNR